MLTTGINGVVTRGVVVVHRVEGMMSRRRMGGDATQFGHEGFDAHYSMTEREEKRMDVLLSYYCSIAIFKSSQNW